jgi:hypothetical protein
MIRIVPAALIVLQLGCCPSDAQVATTGSTAMSLPTVPGAVVISPLNSPGPFSATTEPGAPDTTLAPVPLASNPTTPGTVVVCAPPSNSPALAPAIPVVSSTGLPMPGSVAPVLPVMGQISSSTGTIPAAAPAGAGTINAWRADDECCVSAALDPASAGQSGAWDDPGGHQRGRRDWH